MIYGRPILLYHPFEVKNWSFEDDAPGSGVPSGWTRTDGNASSWATVDDRAHSPGEGYPSRKSAKVYAQSGSDYPEIRQRFSLSDIPSELRGENGITLGAYVMQRAENLNGFAGGEIWLHFYSGGTATPGSGTWVNSNRWGSTGESSGINGQWRLIGQVADIPEDADWVDLALDYDPDEGATGSGNGCWFDRVFSGRVIEFTEKGIAKAKVKRDYGFVNAYTDATIEVMRVRRPKATVDLEIRNVQPSSRIGVQLRDLENMLGSDDLWKPAAFWLNGRTWTNAEGHFQRLVMEPKLSVEFPKGPFRRHLRIQLTAPSEA